MKLDSLWYQLTDMISLSISSDSGSTEMLNLSLCSRARAFYEVTYASRRHV